MKRSEKGNSALKFEQIIKLVSRQSPGTRQDGKTIYVVDSKTGDMQEEAPFFNFGNRYRYFEIAHSAVARDIAGPEFEVRYSSTTQPLAIWVNYDVKAEEKGIFNLLNTVYSAENPLNAINFFLKQKIESWLFEKKDFVSELNKNLAELERFIVSIGHSCGLELVPLIDHSLNEGPEDPVAETFINLSQQVMAKTRDGQNVEIDHTLALTLEDPIKFKLSGKKDFRSWLRSRLEQHTLNAVIEKSYAEVIINMQDSIIRDPMKQDCRAVGYNLKQLITVPGLDKERFYFETANDKNPANTEFVTKDSRLKIPVNMVVEGRLDLHDKRTSKHIVPGFDIIASLRSSVISHARAFINTQYPEDCFSDNAFDEKLAKEIRTQLMNEYGFRELGLIVKYLENEMSERLRKLMERPFKAELRADWSEKKYFLWFKVEGVVKDGWFAFQSTNYKSTEEELADISKLVSSWIENDILRSTDNIKGELIVGSFNQVKKRVALEFGLAIRLFNLTQEFSVEEEIMLKNRHEEREEGLVRGKIMRESERNQLGQYLKLKEKAIQDEENEDVIKKIDEKIAAFKLKEEDIKKRFMEQKTNTKVIGFENEEKPEE